MQLIATQLCETQDLLSKVEHVIEAVGGSAGLDGTISKDLQGLDFAIQRMDDVIRLIEFFSMEKDWGEPNCIEGLRETMKLEISRDALDLILQDSNLREENRGYLPSVELF